MMKMSMQVKPAKAWRLKASLIANDNEATLWSRLPWREQRTIAQRVDDLQWQINYATTKLKKWQDLDSGHWDSLVEMQSRAQKELDNLMLG